MNTVDIWKNQLVLRWDGTPPKNAPPIFKEEELPEYWRELGGHAKYVEKMRAFFLTLSVQNLQRLRRQFGSNVQISKGYFAIDNLKESFKEHKGMVSRALEAKSEESSVEIDYKLKPLGPYQNIGSIFLSTVEKAPLFADCGTGKTFMVLVSTEHQIKQGLLEPGKTLILAKLNTLHSGWLEDAKKFTDLKVNCLWLGTNYKRKEKLRAILDDPADVYVINHEGAKALEKELIEKKFDKVVIDESTILKGFKGLNSRIKGGTLGKCMMRIAEHAKWRVVMSGTPAPNGIQDLWGQMHFLDPNGFLLEASYKDFRVEYMQQHYFGKVDKVTGKPKDPNTPSKWIPKQGAIPKVSSLIKDLSYRVNLREQLDCLPERTDIPRYVPMGKEQTKHYKNMQKNLFAEIEEDKYISVSVKLAQIAKLRQITSGFLIDDQEKPNPISDAKKLTALDSLIIDEINHKEKVVIWGQYRWEIETITSRYKDFGAVSVYGNNSTRQNIENIDAFLKDPSRRLIVLHPQSAAHGITFTVAHYMIFYSISYSAEEEYQCTRRIERAGQKHPMFIYYLLSPDSIDEVMYRVVREKIKNQDELIEQNIIDNEILKQWGVK